MKILKIIAILFLAYSLLKMLMGKILSKQEKIALEKFKEKYSEPVSSTNYKQVGINSFIVTINFGRSKPNARSFWEVDLGKQVATELSLEETKQLIDVPTLM